MKICENVMPYKCKFTLFQTEFHLFGPKSIRKSVITIQNLVWINKIKKKKHFSARNVLIEKKKSLRNSSMLRVSKILRQRVPSSFYGNVFAFFYARIYVLNIRQKSNIWRIAFREMLHEGPIEDPSWTPQCGSRLWCTGGLRTKFTFTY